MKLYRYFCDSTDEFPNEGIFGRLGSLSRIEDNKYDEEIGLLISNINNELPYPDNEVTTHLHRKGAPMLCFFTETGIDEFKWDILDIEKYLLEKHNTITKCGILNIDENSNRILYKDKYQVVLSV